METIDKFNQLERLISGHNSRIGFVKLPYALAQDCTLFVLMQQQNIATWKKKLYWIAEHGGMALITTHPDYMYFGQNLGSEEYPVQFYQEFLGYIKCYYVDMYRQALPLQFI